MSRSSHLKLKTTCQRCRWSSKLNGGSIRYLESNRCLACCHGSLTRALCGNCTGRALHPLRLLPRWDPVLGCYQRSQSGGRQTPLYPINHWHLSSGRDSLRVTFALKFESAVPDPHVFSLSQIFQRLAALFNQRNKDIYDDCAPMDAVNVKVQAVSTRLAHHHASERGCLAPQWLIACQIAHLVVTVPCSRHHVML